MPKKTTTGSTKLTTSKKTVKKTAPKKEVKIKVPKQVATSEPRQGREVIELETKKVVEPIEIKKPTAKEKYYEAMGGRKESVARVRLYTKKATDLPAMPAHAGQAGVAGEDKALITVNGKDYREYFSDVALWEIVESPLKKLKSTNRFKVTVVVHGGGKSGQAGAIKHGIARTLVYFDQNFRKKLKKSGYLTRDPRAKERRKYGLKKARKAPRWAKR